MRRSLRVARNIASPIRIYGGGILLALPLVFGATEPLRNAAMLGRVTVVPAERTEMRFVERPLRLVTSRVLEEFSLPQPHGPHFALIGVRERFFRTEIPYGSLIYQEARRNDLPPELVAAIVKAESDFRPSLISNRSALGLMQVVPSTGRTMGARDLMNPSENVRVGTNYLKYLHRRFNGDLRLVLAAYNAGEGNIARFGGIPPFRETEDYLEKVVVAKRQYQHRLAQRAAVARLEENFRRAMPR